MKTTMDYVKAVSFATQAHLGQTYNEGSSYTMHLAYVEDVVNRFNFGSINLRIAAWLHDTIEDTQVSYNDIKKEFNEEIAEIVFAVTDELGRNRQERHNKTYHKIQANENAQIIKLADRIANIEFGLQTGNRKKLEMYFKEYQEFKQILYNENLQNMWNHLDKLIEKINLEG
jgi:(p)ppGpp synthase/HD superfamily hydrolase